MKKGRIKKVLLTSGAIFLLLVVVLCIHIYLVTRAKPADENTIIMARIDIKQPITTADAAKITNWMYQQQGVSHVLCNAAMDNVVFTFKPLHGNANTITNDFKTTFNFPAAARYIPSEKDLKSGCPVASTSYTYKLYSFFRHTF